ncbi:unnamed protein product [Microthlaspi erraticum]|uniref:Uncharacterized protein n=1 Tax=Microthlaspi erraticum TaxID=1685480 RepID=A0A6D2IH80_9BRAS|nr:unnamed protein product [Microthlaspi erraticum]
MILHDSVFITEFIIRSYERENQREKTGDPLMDEPCRGEVVRRDLILLENQLPYFLLDKLFEPIIHTLFHRGSDMTLRKLVTDFFYCSNEIGDDSKFRHFTDLLRCVRVETLPGKYIGEVPVMTEMYHADKLHSGGVNFKAVYNMLSLDVEFKNGCLNIPRLWVNYIFFLDSLIDSEKDVALLVEKGIIENGLGDHGSVATMVNRLGLGLTDFGSYYSFTAYDVNCYSNNSWNKSRAVLKSVYFSNPWRGTATVAATLLLLLTLVQTVTSVMQVLQKDTP